MTYPKVQGASVIRLNFELRGPGAAPRVAEHPVSKLILFVFRQHGAMSRVAGGKTFLELTSFQLCKV